jgi:hypothetical protein
MRNYFDLTEKELRKKMEESAPGRSDYIACFDILLLRGHERLIEKTEDLVRKTRWIAFATWAVAGVTIIIAILARP